MPLREVKLVAGAKEKAREGGVPVGFLQSDEQYDREVKNGKAQVTNRDFHQLRYHHLIDDASIADPAADQPEAEKEADTSRTRTRKRGPSGTNSSVDPGGTGHQEGEHYNNADRVQGEIAKDQDRGAKARSDAGQPPVADEETDETKRQDGRLAEDKDEDKNAKSTTRSKSTAKDKESS